MERLFFAVFVTVLTCPISMVLASPAAAEPRPNVIVVMADDMGYADLGAHGCEDIKTPNLDRLAARGVTFSSGYTTHSFCGPARAGFFAGRYQQRFGFEGNPHYDPANEHLGLPVTEITFVQRLKDAGYFTGGIGKWHLGASSPYYPLNRGFDYFYGFLGGGHDYFTVDLSAPVGTNYKGVLIRNKQPATFEGYLTDALSADAVQFIERHADDDQPFFLYVGYNAPHGPMQATEADLKEHDHIEDWMRRTYAAMVFAMDRGIGEILDALDAEGIADNTLVVFFSDNGGPQPVTWSKWFQNGSDNGPLREGKSFVYEGGIRVPFLMSWPGTLPQGKTYDEPVISIDISRTAVDLAGGDAMAKPAMEGVNLIPYLTGETDGSPHDALFWRQWNGRDWAIRKGELKSVAKGLGGDKQELYDLSEDIGETTDLSTAEAGDAADLLRTFDAWNADNIDFNFWNAGDYQKKLKEFHEAQTGP
ncbi:MAG: sulfatase-like hydrolase/transferase [Planctomycetota bacterium]